MAQELSGGLNPWWTVQGYPPRHSDSATTGQDTFGHYEAELAEAYTRNIRETYARRLAEEEEERRAARARELAADRMLRTVEALEGYALFGIHPKPAPKPVNRVLDFKEFFIKRSKESGKG